ncbi:hypothetical protein OPT61_g5355 [Boeremia exigua]|uniref:Uncharacterized protein n=1 Tax=Boeremia exigua TaxID=749465 RepID=A0ACC2IAT0_9PLEO|nr:hypothetical protein OPT61_g5355 [Boeremia exigua]
MTLPYTVVLTGKAAQWKRPPTGREESDPPAQVNRVTLLKLRYTATWFFRRFEKKGTMSDLDHAISVRRKVVDITPGSDPNRIDVLDTLLRILCTRFQMRGLPQDLDEAIVIFEEVVDIMPASDPDLPQALNSLAGLLSQRFNATRSLKDLDHAIEIVENVAVVTLAIDPERIPILNSLLRMFRQRFDMTGSVDDLDRLVDIGNLKLDATPDDHPDRATRMTDMATLYQQRFELTRSLDDIHKAVSLGSLAIAAVPLTHSLRPVLFESYAKTLALRSSIIGSFHDLDDAIDVSAKAIKLASNNPQQRLSCEHTHSVLLKRQFSQKGSTQSLDAAIQMARVTANAIPPDSQNRFLYRANLGKLLEIRFCNTGSLEDLDGAIDLLQDVVKNAPIDDPHQRDHMTTLSISLGQRFQATGKTSDIHQAIAISSAIVDSTAEDDPYRARHLANLGNLVGPRYESTGLIDDLDFAIESLEKAVALPSHLQSNAVSVHFAEDMNTNEGGLWVSLGYWLSQRFERTGSMEDLNRSIHICEKAIEKTPLEDCINRALHYNHLGGRLSKRFALTKERDDIDRALKAVQTAVDLTPNDHPYKVSHLISLGNSLFTRYNEQKSEKDIEDAIELLRKAVDLTAPEHINYAMYLNNLGNLFGRRYQVTNLREYLDDALLYYNEGASCETSPPVDRVESARQAAMILADQEKWEEAACMLETAIELLPRTSPRLLNNTDKQHRLGTFSGLASFAAAASIKAGHDPLNSLQLLETGRGLIGASLMELRTDISELRDKHPDIAERFETLRDELDKYRSQRGLHNSRDSVGKIQGSRLGEADEELTNLIVGIRDYPGFERFLLPPSQEDFHLAASKGPLVIINMNYYRCDAILVTKDRIWSLPLPNLKERDINERAKTRDTIQSGDTLRWLWGTVVGPILNELGYLDAPSTDDWPQVWWIPTGPLNNFPIHAAGFHIEENSESALDRVMSSYSPSVKSLIAGRAHSLQVSSCSASDHALLVAMQETKDSSSLPNATKEIEMLAKLCPSLHLEAVIPTRREKHEIMEGLRGCKIFHFAGHGKSSIEDPAKSLLLLSDWKERPLTVGDLRDMNMHERAPFLGFLSACSTSSNKRIRLIDESIHLAGSLQIAGFRHVIGTLWEVKDSYCVEAAQTVYETLRDEGMNDTAVCRALHKAVRKLRENCMLPPGGVRNATMLEDEETSSTQQVSYTLPTHWVPYIHFGV